MSADIPPILRIWPICSFEVIEVETPARFQFLANALALSSSTPRRASSTRPSMSPMPRMRDAMRSGWKPSPELFADTGELERLAGYLADRQRSTATGVTIQFGQHHTGQGAPR